MIEQGIQVWLTTSKYWSVEQAGPQETWEQLRQFLVGEVMLMYMLRVLSQNEQVDPVFK